MHACRRLLCPVGTWVCPAGLRAPACCGSALSTALEASGLLNPLALGINPCLVRGNNGYFFLGGGSLSLIVFCVAVLDLAPSLSIEALLSRSWALPVPPASIPLRCCASLLCVRALLYASTILACVLVYFTFDNAASWLYRSL